MEKEWEKLENIQALQLTKVRNKKEVIEEARNKGRKVHFVSLMDLCHLKNSELEPQYQKYQGRVVLRGDIVKCTNVIENSKVRMPRHFDTFVNHDTNGQNHGPVWKIWLFLSKGNLYGHPLAGLLWERQFEKVLLEHGWENFKLGMFICQPSKRTIPISVCGRYQTGR